MSLPVHITLLAAVVMAPAFLAPAPLHAQGAVPLIVDGAWLARRLEVPRQVILHAAASRAEYDAGHIPGARFLAFSSYAIQREGRNSEIAPVAQLDSLLEAAGVSDGDHVVIYGQPLQMARLLVTLDYLGLKGRVSVLDGGIDAWREGRRPISREAPRVAPGTFTPRIDSTVLADADWVRGVAERSRVQVLDARSPEFFLGVSAGQMPRAGRIPGARNVPFSSLTGELTTQRDAGRVRRLFAEAGVARGDTVVTYCHIGMQASLLYLAARRLGHPVRIYDGSFEEWSRRSDFPVDTGR